VSDPADPSPGEQRQPYQDHPLAGPVLNIGRALLNVGSPAHRLEAAMQVMAERLGIKAEFFSTPTALIASLGDGSRQQTFMARAEPGQVNLAKLADLTDVMERLASGTLEPAAANQRVHEIERAPERYRGLIRYFAFLLAAAGISVLLGGGWRELILGALLGGVTGGLVMAFSRRVDVRHLVTPVAAFLVTLLGTLWCARDPATALMPAIIAGVIMLVPGLDLTIATRELASGHLVSGSARLAQTLIIFALLTFGLALGGMIGAWIGGAVELRVPSPRPNWLIAVGFGMAALGFTLQFQAYLRDWPFMLMSCLVAWSALLAGQELGAPILGAFIGGLAVGLAGNLFARATRRPGSIVHLPGLILLVPGSIGLRSLSALLGDDVLAGLETGMLAALVAVGLSTGMILAGVLVRPRNLL
jgi:uncharacterized membrane protein YjjP (DUF1212 family)